MRTASSYRGAKKRAAREAKVPFAQYNEHYERSRHYAAAELERQAEARKALAQWASSKPEITDQALAQLNTYQLEPLGDKEHAAQIPTLEGRKIKIEDIDKALENTLTKWQAAGHSDPLLLSKLFAARARQLGWIEGVEFAEDNT